MILELEDDIKIFDCTSSDDEPHISKSVKNTENTWGEDRSEAVKYVDTKNGKIAENIVISNKPCYFSLYLYLL